MKCRSTDEFFQEEAARLEEHRTRIFPSAPSAMFKWFSGTLSELLRLMFGEVDLKFDPDSRSFYWESEEEVTLHEEDQQKLGTTLKSYNKFQIFVDKPLEEELARVRREYEVLGAVGMSVRGALRAYFEEKL